MMKPTEEPGVFWDEESKRFVVALYHPETESRYFFGRHKTLEKAIRVRNAERDTGGFKTTRKPRSWSGPKMPQDDPPAPETTRYLP